MNAEARPLFVKSHPTGPDIRHSPPHVPDRRFDPRRSGLFGSEPTLDIRHTVRNTDSDLLADEKRRQTKNPSAKRKRRISCRTNDNSVILPCPTERDECRPLPTNLYLSDRFDLVRTRSVFERFRSAARRSRSDSLPDRRRTGYRERATPVGK